MGAVEALGGSFCGCSWVDSRLTYRNRCSPVGLSPPASLTSLCRQRLTSGGTVLPTGSCQRHEVLLQFCRLANTLPCLAYLDRQQTSAEGGLDDDGNGSKTQPIFPRWHIFSLVYLFDSSPLQRQHSHGYSRGKEKKSDNRATTNKFILCMTA